jgi:MtrB/PioB family decaheme-associated outer membrane protein
MIDRKYVLRLILIIALILLPLISADADDSSTANNSVNSSSSFFGEIGLTPHVDTVSGNRTKLYEYYDPTPYGGINSDIRLGYDSDIYWLKIKVSDIGYKTQEYHVDGGMYGKFSYDIYFTDMVHNISLGAKTFYNNPGSSNLTYAPGSTAFQDPTASTWTSFDYSIKREKLGGNFDVEMLRPFYVDFSASRERITGTNTGADDGYELPVPVDYTSDTAKGEIGYQAKPVFAALSYLYNSFDNQNQTLSNETTTGSTFIMALPPDNNYYKLAFKGSVQLPMDSRFNATASTAKATSTFNLGSLLYSNYGTTSVASAGTFYGRLDTKTLNLSLTSNPVRWVYANIFYRFYDTTNKSDQVTVNDPVANGGDGLPYQNYLFDYKKDTYGAELRFKLPMQLQLKTAYTYVATDRKGRLDNPSTNDNIYSTELKWSGLDCITPKLSYERLDRNATYGILNSSVTGDVAPIALINSGYDATAGVDTSLISRFDTDNQTRDTYKAGFDIAPLRDLNLGIAYKYIKTDYSDAVLGIQNTRTNEWDITGDYALGSIARLAAYFDLEYIKYLLYDINDEGGGSYPLNTTANFSTSYPWNVTTKDNTYEWGAGADIYIIPKKLTLKLQYDYVNSDGTLDFGIFNSAALGDINPGANNNNVDISAWDSYRKSAFTAKIVYNISKSFAMAAGASVESYKYNDIIYSNYLYNSNNGSSNPLPILTGAYANPSYSATVVFLTSTYRF